MSGDDGKPENDRGPEGSGVPVRAETRGRVRVLRWDRQHRRNALDPASLLVLAEHIAEAKLDPEIGACVLTGTGEVAFSSGMDLKALAEDPGSAGGAVKAWMGALDDPDRVVLIAAVNGMAMGGGFEIAMRCDLVVAADHATFGLPEVTKGIVPGGGALGLSAMVPVQAAVEMAVLGEHLPAERVHQLGLVNRVVPAAELLDTAVELGERIAGYPDNAVTKIRSTLWQVARDNGAAPSL